MNIYSPVDFNEASQNIIKTCNFLNSKGWIPATSGNFSQKVSPEYCAITVSGKHKGYLTPSDIMVVDLEGNPIDEKIPSAETLLHTTLYLWDSSINNVLHTHSVTNNVLGLLIDKPSLQLKGYELLKVFNGISTHDTSIEIPIFENTQDIPILAQEVINYLKKDIPCWGYLIKGHGLYTWGKDMTEALRHLEAIEYLLECELELIKIRGLK